MQTLPLIVSVSGWSCQGARPKDMERNAPSFVIQVTNGTGSVGQFASKAARCKARAAFELSASAAAKLAAPAGRSDHRVATLEVAKASWLSTRIALAEKFVAFDKRHIALAEKFIAVAKRNVALADKLVAVAKRNVALAEKFVAFVNYNVALPEESRRVRELQCRAGGEARRVLLGFSSNTEATENQSCSRHRCRLEFAT